MMKLNADQHAQISRLERCFSMRLMWVGGIGWSGAATEGTRFLCSLHIFDSQQSGGGCKQCSRDLNLER
jgi:hypothetical protein